MAESKIERHRSRLRQLENARSGVEAQWRAISEQLAPHRTVWSPTANTSGQRKDLHLYNSRPQQYLRTLVAGLMAGITSPARDWFGLTTSDPKLAEVDSVKNYLDECRRIIASAMQASNWYRALSSGTYIDLASVATGAMFHDDLGGGRISFMSMPLGEYYLDVNHEGRVDTCYRKLGFTTRQMVQKFGLARCSASVRNAWSTGNYDTVFVVIHAVTPNGEREAGSYGARGMAYSSCWYQDADERPDTYLRESGYEEFPVLAPRWTVTRPDIYGHGPGWIVLGDCKQLQHLEKRKIKMFDMQTDAPLKASDNLKRAALIPGAITHVGQGQNAMLEPILTVPPGALDEARQEIAVLEQRIAEGMFADLWRMLLDDARNERPTATEVEERREEKMLMLGPLLENLNNELLEPAVERTFHILERADLLPLPPPELEGHPVKVEFISIMHQMQQKTGLVGIRTLMQEVQNIAQTHPDVVDKIDADAVVDELARISGVRPNIVRSKDKVDQQRAMRAEQEQAKQTGEAMLQATQGISNLSSADPAKLSELAATITPAAAAQGGALGPPVAA